MFGKMSPSNKREKAQSHEKTRSDKNSADEEDAGLISMTWLFNEAMDKDLEKHLIGVFCNIASLYCSVHKTKCEQGAVVCTMASCAAKSVRKQRKYAKKVQELASTAVQARESRKRDGNARKADDKTASGSKNTNK